MVKLVSGMIRKGTLTPAFEPLVSLFNFMLYSKFAYDLLGSQ